MKRSFQIFLIILAFSVVSLGLYAFSLYVTAPNFEAVELGEDFKVQTLFYSHKDTPERTIIIFPPTGGTNILDKLYAHALFSAGCDVYIIASWTGSDESGLDLESHQRHYTRSRNAVGLILKKIKSPFIGIMGTSVGGLHTTVSMGTHDRLNSALVITAGLPITEVVVHSNQKAMVDGKKKRYEMYHFKNDAEYLEALNRAFTIDAMKLPHKFEGKKLGVVIAHHDYTVPTVNQMKLKEFWNARVVSENNFDHYYGIVTTAFFKRGKVVEFFTTP